MEQYHQYYPICSGPSISVICLKCKEQWRLKLRWQLLLRFFSFLFPVSFIILYFQTEPPYQFLLMLIIGLIGFLLGQLIPPQVFCFFLRKSKNIEKYLNQTN